ncbi:Hypothetical predicted protein [Scomber scombrus]|uniref:Uncharacterized protein n=1 Tax=Scomber scombrus TaxID=13677 RepID=A0AAV1N5H2_SCOSC
MQQQQQQGYINSVKSTRDTRKKPETCCVPSNCFTYTVKLCVYNNIFYRLNSSHTDNKK